MKCDTLLIAVSPATVKAHMIARGRTLSAAQPGELIDSTPASEGLIMQAPKPATMATLDLHRAQSREGHNT